MSEKITVAELKDQIASLSKIGNIALVLTFLVPIVSFAVIYITNYMAIAMTFEAVLVIMFVFAMITTSIMSFAAGLRKAIRVIQAEAKT